MPIDVPAVCGHGTREFLLAVVVAPSALGLLVRRVVGDSVAARLKPTLKAVNATVVLLLCYSNATVALPQVVTEPGGAAVDLAWFNELRPLTKIT